MNTATIRTRWAAVGAAAAISLGGGGIGLISAAPLSSGERPVLVPLNCRLADTRPAPDTVGTRTTPIGAGETVTFSAHGTNGNCTIPADATALSLNVTALNITAPLTFLTLWNTDVAQPTTSSLNPAAGQPPTPNAVTVDLSATGQFNLFNALGTLDVLVDVTGYYQDHHHDDRYYTKAEIDGALAPTTGYVSVPEGAFKARDWRPDVTTTFGNGGAYIVNLNGGSDGLVAPVSLPHGAVLTRMTVYFFDSTALGGENVTATLYRYSPTGGSFPQLAQVSTFGGGGLQVEVANLNHTVDNSAIGYELLVTGAVATDRRVRGAIVEYTL